MSLAQTLSRIPTAILALINSAEQPTNKGQPNGYVGLDANSVVEALIAMRHGTTSYVTGLTGEAGELMVATDTGTVYAHDGITVGGRAVGLGSPCALSVSGLSTPTVNGVNLKAAMTAAASLTPNGAALSHTNRATVLLLPGTYLASTITHTNPYIDLVGVGAPGSVRIHTAAAADFNIQDNIDFSIKNITFYSTGGVAAITFGLTGSPSYMYWEDVLFDVGGVITVPAMAIINAALSWPTTAIVKRCGTLGINFFGGFSGPPTMGSGTLFEDCYAGNASFAHAASILNGGKMGGTMRRCILNLTSAWFTRIDSTGVLERCQILGSTGVKGCIAGAKFVGNTIIPGSSGSPTCIDAVSGTISITSYGNFLKTFSAAAPYGPHVSNQTPSLDTTSDNLA